MDISITKPYSSSENRIIEIENVTITLDKRDLEDLFEQLDSELHYNTTREDLIKELEEVKAERDELFVENDELKEGTI